MDKARWIRAGTKLAEPLRELELVTEQLGLSLVHATAYGTENGLTAEIRFHDEDQWYIAELRDGHLELSVGGEKSYYIQT